MNTIWPWKFSKTESYSKTIYLQDTIDKEIHRYNENNMEFCKIGYTVKGEKN